MKNVFTIGMLVLAVAACDTDKPPPRKGPVTTSSSSSGSSGEGGSSGQGGMGGTSGAGGQGGASTGGSGGGLPAPVCGDLTINPGEECDDGNTVPGDGCAADCLIESGETEPNDTAGQASTYVKMPYYAKVNPETDVDFVSFTVANSNVSIVVRTMDVGDGACAIGTIDTVVDVLAPDGTTVLGSDDDSGEGNCSRIALPSVTAGTYYARIAAGVKTKTGTFVYRLRVDEIMNVCGDGVVTAGETCDDGNMASGDGCSSSCIIEITETEPNGTIATANSFKEPWNAVLTPLSDVDVIAVDVPTNGASLTATTTDQGTNACAAKKLDTVVEILAPDGVTVLASGDDIVGNCGSALATNLTAAKYFVRVKGGSLVTDPSPYGLQIIIN